MTLIVRINVCYEELEKHASYFIDHIMATKVKMNPTKNLIIFPCPIFLLIP